MPGSEVCESDTQEEHRLGYALRATQEDTIENVNFGLEELGGLLQGPRLYSVYISAVDMMHDPSCDQYFSMSADSCLRDTSTQVIQYSRGQATNYLIESVPPQPHPF